MLTQRSEGHSATLINLPDLDYGRTLLAWGWVMVKFYSPPGD